MRRRPRWCGGARRPAAAAWRCCAAGRQALRGAAPRGAAVRPAGRRVSFKPISRAAWQRVLPFAFFIAVLALRQLWQAHDPGFVADERWLYALQAGGAALLLAWAWRHYVELASAPRLRDVLLAVAMGVAVWWLWIALDAPWMRIATPVVLFRPVGVAGDVLWSLVAVRWLGATLVVPLMEELFWRSWLMRWLERADFLSVDPRTVGTTAVLASTFVFTLAHNEWFAAALAGLAYAGLYRHSGSLWSPVIAHAVTNGLLGVWVVMGGHWAYW